MYREVKKMIDFKDLLISYAVGDAMGMVTEFMTNRQISKKFGYIDRLTDPSASFIHQNLLKGQVTDDTEQVLYLIKQYGQDRSTSQESVIKALIQWFDECSPHEKGYIGPSAMKAITEYKKGNTPDKNGTTSGCCMRILAPVIASMHKPVEILHKAVVDCTVVTHDTSLAVESSMAMAYAYFYAPEVCRSSELIDIAIKGAAIGEALSEREFVGPSVRRRLEQMKTYLKCESEQSFMREVYYCLGTTMQAVDVVCAAIGISAFSKADVWKSICMGASIGGDTDTIAALAGSLSYMASQTSNIPDEVVQEVGKVNKIDFYAYEDIIKNILGVDND